MTNQKQQKIPQHKQHNQGLPVWLTGFAIPFVQLILAFGLASLLVLAIGQSPLDVMTVLVRGAFNLDTGLPSTLYNATSLIFTGLAVVVAFHAGLFNIGGEGQAYFAGLGVTLACLAFGHVLPAPLMFIVAIIGALVFGGAYGFIPGVLQAKRGAHVVVTTIMLNYIVFAFMNYAMRFWLSKSEGSTDSANFAESSVLPRLADMMPFLGFSDTPLNFSFFLALLTAGYVWWLIWRSRLGYEIRVVGQNPQAAVYAGISVSKTVISTMVISGALAGLMAVNVVYGAQGRLSLSFTSGIGFMGIAVALMGRNHPVGVVLSALLFGALAQGGSEMQFELPDISPEFNVVIQGLIIFFVAALDGLIRKPIEGWYRNMQGAK
ncbi:ABC transporter permease [Hydromonas duriensis]|uniref:Nucleoside ABC transporter membrane protein n=1 Tax=Hydromonas duriensis TaxID=1527608 RepID=A0A4R6YC11_9BURK|nr:ABC transporter permease [Hydromonas duriensis]TDR33108.1 nucleoside ABC transporter membrane protein [Hydromonas duriensis]